MNITETVREILADVVPELNSRLEDQVFDEIAKKYYRMERATNIYYRHRNKFCETHYIFSNKVNEYYLVMNTTHTDKVDTILQVGTAILIDNFIKHLSTATTSYDPACLNLWINEAVEMNNLPNLETLNHLYITQQLNK